MSFHFYLYRAPKDLPPLNLWHEMQAESLGTVQEVKQQLSELYPELKWREVDGSWIGAGPNGIDDPYLDVSLRDEESQHCCFVVLNKAPPSVMRKIMEALDLNYVCAPEAGDLVDPFAYADGAPHYAKKDWRNGS